MKYAVRLEEDYRNCFPEKSNNEHINIDMLLKEPFNNILFEHEYEDIEWEDLTEVDGKVCLDEEKYSQNRLAHVQKPNEQPVYEVFFVAEMDYKDMIIEAQELRITKQEKAIEKQQADIDYVLMITEG